MAKFRDRHGEYDPNEVRYLTMGGGQVRHGDELFEQEVSDWEREGVPTDLIYMARPLLDGTPEQQQKAHDFLTKQRGRHSRKDAADMQMGMLALLNREGLTMGTVRNDSDADVMAGWDEISGDRNPSYEGWTTGKSAGQAKADGADS